MDHFLCYSVKEEEKSKEGIRVRVENQFGTQVFIVGKAQFLCVPSSKEVLP